MSITKHLSEFTSELSYSGLPQEVATRCKFLILDCIGNAVRARAEAESTSALLSAVHVLGLANGSARVFADERGYAPAGAVLVNATLAHSLDFDDTHAAAIVHAGAPVIPAALAAAEITGASGAEVIAAVVAGYEVALRLALALPAGAHYDRGFHPSATCGVFGAAAAAACIFGLSAEQTASAFGIALSQSSGSLQFLSNGAWTKRFQVGWAGMSGFVAATLARENFIGASYPIEGKHGFLNAYAPSPNPERVIQNLGTDWELMQMGVKPYPSCRWGHAGIDAAIALRKEHDFRPEAIASVTLGLSRAGMLLIGEPVAKKRNPENIVDAQFSGPFVIAMALTTGNMEWDSYKRLDDPAIRRLMSQISCVNDPDIEVEFPANMSGKLTIVASGQTYTKKVIVPKGEPAHFLNATELQTKFMGLAAPVLGASRADGLAETVLGLQRIKRAAMLFENNISAATAA
ncbi:MAG: MmgE/PrpD family protein [Proteobacteria bacterium]|nr:MmgE/PrpD family protein [Pseudomonadota bacterium]